MRLSADILMQNNLLNLFKTEPENMTRTEFLVRNSTSSRS